MKKFLICLLLLCYLIHSFTVQGQTSESKPAVKNPYLQLDTRIDNMGYWMEMAARGFTQYNPDVPIHPEVFKGSSIRVKGVLTTNSPDIAVTSLTDVTESENSVFIDPANADYLLNSNNSTSWSGGSVGSVFGANYFQSADEGTTWTGSSGGAGGSNRGDPTTAIGLNGREYVNFISSASGQGIAYSDDGTTWNTATIAPNPGSLADKNHMWIDNSLSSPHEGNLYTAWTDFGGTDDAEIKISRSINDGVTWSTPLNISSAISAGSHNQGVNIQTGPGGEVYAAWAVYDSWPSDETAIGFAKSTNGGVSFTSATRIISNIKGIRTTAVSKNHRVNSFPSMAADISGGPNNGNLYIVWTNVGTPGTNTGTNKSIYMVRSTNGGTSWSAPVRVNQGSNTDGKEAYMPWISCDPETGVLSVIFYDDRNVSSTECEVYVSYSVDAGSTWTDFQVSDVSFTPAAIPGLASGYMGDYLGITSRGGKVYPCWTDNRGGVYMTYVSPFELGLNAGFRANNTTICDGAEIIFTDISTGPPLSWNWSFPGGTPSSYEGKNPPVVIYSDPGTFDVSLTVSDGTLTDTETKTGYIIVKNVIAGFTAVPVDVIVGNHVIFSDNSSCNPGNWDWSFPGGNPSSYSGQNPPPVIYNTLGTYDVSLTVTKDGASDTRLETGYITVKPPVFNMANGTVTTCSGDFYDSGGPSGVYQNNEVYIETFYPSVSGSMLRFNFTSFSTELNYDTLTIYNGTSTSAPIIGKYHGSTGPGTVTATNAAGALTFRWRSDISLTYNGWAATISCANGIVGDPASFTASSISSSRINLAWTKNMSNNDIMVVWSPTSTFGIPADGTLYPAGSSIPGGGTVLYRGNLDTYEHSGLSQNTTFYYKAFSYTPDNIYSGGFPVSATTFCGYNSLPLTENFPTSTLPGCWTKQISGTGGIDKWTVSNTTNAGGAAYEMKSTYQSVNPGITRLVTPPFNTLGATQLNLSFRHYLDAYSSGCTLRIQSSTDGITWTNETWSVAATSSNIGPALVNTTILNNLNSLYTQIAFTIEGNLYQYDYWYIDNVSVINNCTVFNQVDVQVTPSANGVCAGAPVTFTATPVNGGTDPVYQWNVNGSVSGLNSPVFTYIPANGDTVTVILTSNITCTTGNPATSNPVVMVVSPILTINVSVTPSENPVCEGDTVLLTALPVNGGPDPSFQWTVNGLPAGADSSIFKYIPFDRDTVACIMTSSIPCSLGNPAHSIPVILSVIQSLTTSVRIESSANPVNSGELVTITAFPVNAGETPLFQWTVNGLPAGTGENFLTYTPVDGDTILCVLTSSGLCTLNNPATSNTIIMEVRQIAETLTIQDKTVTGTECFNALQTISVAGEGTTFTVGTGGSATLIAGTNIVFFPEVSVHNGGYLRGTITTSSTFCGEQPKTMINTTGAEAHSLTWETSSVRIYPNPTRGKFILEMDSKKTSAPVNVSIFSCQGRKMIEEQISVSGYHEFDTEPFNPGLYFIRVTSGEEVSTIKLIRE